MPIYEARPEHLTVIPATGFAILGMRERSDIQRLLSARIEALEEGLLVLAEEFTDWSDSSRRIDLLCLDVEAHLVVVEIKRDEDGGHMELQALRYAAMVSAMTFDQAVTALARHRQQEETEARHAILTHLGWETPEEDAFAQETRIILAAANFAKEITTTVLWLRDQYGMDLRCVRLRPHRISDGRVLLDIQTIIPLPEIAEFQTKLGGKRQAERRERAERHDLRILFLQELQRRAEGRTSLHAGRTPSDMGVLSGSIGRAGFSINYVVGRQSARVELLIQAKDAKEQLHRLTAHMVTIEASFGSVLEVQEKEASRQCRILHTVQGGYRSPEVEWPRIQDELIAAMIRLDAALRPRMAALP